MTQRYIGLMSGTSMDGIDAALLEFDKGIKTLASLSFPLPDSLKHALHELTHPGNNEIMTMGIADRQLGLLFAEAVNQLLEKAQLTPQDIKAIGSHGQTIRHHPWQEYPFTLQIGDPNVIAAYTGITTVADFRRRDMALGGQGAPLTPAFHEHFFSDSKKVRAVVNVGGISNVTLLIPGKTTTGFDTGPGNTLLDRWCHKHLNQPIDREGAWGASGKLAPTLLEELLKDPYFSKPAPKSTGREHFNILWLEKALQQIQQSFSPQDIQTTLVHLTARCIVDAFKNIPEKVEEIIVCGGGCHNQFLMKTLKTYYPQGLITTSADFGLDPDYVEAAAFAWFAKQTLEGKPSNLPAVTGAKELSVLGGIYLA